MICMINKLYPSSTSYSNNTSCSFCLFLHIFLPSLCSPFYIFSFPIFLICFVLYSYISYLSTMFYSFYLFLFLYNFNVVNCFFFFHQYNLPICFYSTYIKGRDFLSPCRYLLWNYSNRNDYDECIRCQIRWNQASL